MTTNNAIGLQTTNNADGVSIGGGIISRLLTWLGSNITMTGAGSNIYTFPTSTSTLASLGLAETFTAVKTFSAAINPTISQTTLSGTTAGSILYSEPLQGSSLKIFAAYASGYENNTTTSQTITYATAFTNPPIVVGNNTGLTLVTTSATTLTITAPNNTTLFTGNIIIAGY